MHKKLVGKTECTWMLDCAESAEIFSLFRRIWCNKSTKYY